MKKLILTIWVIVIAVLIIMKNSAISQEQWYMQNQFEVVSDLYSIQFINSSSGWIVGDSGLILNTTNGGEDWSLHHISVNSLYSICFVDVNTGWTVGGSSENHSILKSTDGGNIWITQISGTGSIFRSVNFVNSNTGWVVGDRGVILKTINGGNNWVNQTVSTGYDLRSVHFTSINDGWTVGGDGIVLNTTNGGNSWINKSNGISRYLTSVYFKNSTLGWMTGYLETYKTTNGGNNWAEIYYNAPGILNSVHFINDLTGWEVGYLGSIFKSTDGGFINWTRQFSGTNNTLNSVFFINNTTGWTVGNNGTILTTNNMSFYNDVGVQSIIKPTQDSVYNVDCINDKTIVPQVSIKNSGTGNQQDFFDVHFEIKQGENILYSDVKQDTISARQTHNINFDPYTIAFDFGSYNMNLNTYSAKSWTSLPLDSNRTNDTMSSEFKVNNPNYGYSDISGYYFLNSSANAACIPDQPVFQWEDTTGSVNLITNGTLVVPYTDYNGFYFSGCFRLPDVLPDGNKFKFFGTCYDTIVIATNGIIGLGGSMTGMNIPFPVSIPSASAPRPAIFPFWYWCNFLDPEITGRNLKYKVTADKFIVTYDRVPIYNTIINSQDYLSYQVILEIGPGCGIENGKITVQFDDSKSGSYFLNNYYNGNLNANTVGIQDASGTIGIQYRRSESPGNIPVRGPLFGSPMAIAFGQTNETLPVEFTGFSFLVNENNVTLSWQTISEINNLGFDVERQDEGIGMQEVWKHISFINGHGTTSAPANYEFTDRNLSSGKYNYRLRQIDFNGNFEYHDLSDKVVIGVPDMFELSQNYPNPFNPTTNLEFGISDLGFVSLKVYDVLGKEVKTLVNEIKQAGYYKVQFDGSSFASGVYFYELRSGNFVSQKRMLLLK